MNFELWTLWYVPFTFEPWGLQGFAQFAQFVVINDTYHKVQSSNLKVQSKKVQTSKFNVLSVLDHHTAPAVGGVVS